MTEAIISGMLQKELFTPSQITVTNRSDQERLSYFEKKYKINVTYDTKPLIEEADIIILAMKPKDVAQGVMKIAPYVRENQLILSVLAGVSTNTITKLVGKDVAVIRAMPNTSATIGKSATALSLGEFANGKHLQIAKTLFETVGIVTTVEEHDLHAVTGLSGSGPAYVYYLVEAMEKAASEVGLDQDVAKELILQTIIGAAEMLKTSPKQPSLLRKEVTSPGGTTEAGIKVLEQYKYQDAMVSCIKRATERSSELGST
ncbi:pyrroline-5-carboxylate reductase ProI [Cytobacillus sp. S13-E01]|uniref:pyrroline-5-carboxylate reductase ProI n=1 Tax=Cytobacillus sp. S13-E01 TaxID=3031326 RepID=UPI0023D88BC8|nr:pyrroline-5-carboxylate reductase ProI [Cytobacillus sp. S13-E01]MDF0726112.1 pyrroline-5-carboxylate reductase ProI [Cytobacillus sp. S13-E01]